MPNPTVPNVQSQYGDGIKREQVIQAVPLGQPVGRPAPQATPPSPPPTGSAPTEFEQEPVSAALSRFPIEIQRAFSVADGLTQIAADEEASEKWDILAKAAQDHLGQLLGGMQQTEQTKTNATKDENKSSQKKDKK